ncbi:hypothetical protein QJS66_21330 [Kocuria rhizophila]|nr:hypothetical protein QJS66_21330 [Kocuria rhizophila]
MADVVSTGHDLRLLPRASTMPGGRHHCVTTLSCRRRSSSPAPARPRRPDSLPCSCTRSRRSS